jgi:hypothetical protein
MHLRIAVGFLNKGKILLFQFQKGRSKHCAICNIVIEYDEHFISDLHDHNVMEAMTYKDNNNIVKEDKNDSHDSDSEESSTDDDFEDMPSVSYACIAKKPKRSVQLPNFVKINMRGKTMQVKFDHWHMLIRTKPNTIYCMVCKEYYKMWQMSNHCNDPNHLSNLSKCKIVESYKDYLIRQVWLLN